MSLRSVKVVRIGNLYVWLVFHRIIADSFYEKADLEHWIVPKVPYSEYTDILKLLWEPLLEKNLR